MRCTTETIALGEHRFAVRPLTVAQVQAIEPLVFAERETSAASIATAVAILRVALARDHAEAAAELDMLEASAPEIGAAMAQALRLGGFLPHGDTTPGEAGAFYTPEEIDAMPAQDAFALLRHWDAHPPTHEILAAVHRVARAPAPSVNDPSGIATLMAHHPDGNVRG